MMERKDAFVISIIPIRRAIKPIKCILTSVILLLIIIFRKASLNNISIINNTNTFNNIKIIDQSLKKASQSWAMIGLGPDKDPKVFCVSKTLKFLPLKEVNFLFAQCLCLPTQTHKLWANSVLLRNIDLSSNLASSLG